MAQAGATRRSMMALLASSSGLAHAGCGRPVFPASRSLMAAAAGRCRRGWRTGGAPTIGAGRVRVGLNSPRSARPDRAACSAMRCATRPELSLGEFQGADLTLLLKDDRGTADGARAASEEAIRDGRRDSSYGPAVCAGRSGRRAGGARREPPCDRFSTDTGVAARGVLSSVLSCRRRRSRVSLLTLRPAAAARWAR